MRPLRLRIDAATTLRPIAPSVSAVSMRADLLGWLTSRLKSSAASCGSIASWAATTASCLALRSARSRMLPRRLCATIMPRTITGTSDTTPNSISQRRL